MSAIEINHLSKQYKSGTQALKNVSLNVEYGDFFALLGPNGAGKSTLIGILTSLVVKTSGTIKIGGYDLDKEKSYAKSCLGLVPQDYNLNFFETTQNILINQAGYYGIPKKKAIEQSEKYLKLLRLWKYKDEVSRNLSGGLKRRLMIARALVHEPSLLILDEPTAGVDVELRKFIWSFLREMNEKEKKTIILTTHYLEEVEKLCKNVAIINQGKIVSNGSLQDLIGHVPGQTYKLSVNSIDDLVYEELKKKSFQTKKINGTSFEVSLLKSQNINDLFHVLDQFKIQVKRIIPRENPIESAFFHITKGVS